MINKNRKQEDISCKRRYKWFYFKSHLPPKRFPKYLCHRMAQFWSYNCLVVFIFIFYSQTMVLTVLYIIHLLRTIWFYYFNNHVLLNSILVQCVSIGKCQLGTNDHIFNGTLLIWGQVFFHAMINDKLAMLCVRLRNPKYN